MWEEISSEVRKLTTDKKTLKKFAITMAVVLGIFSAIAWYRNSGALPYTLALAIGFLVVGLSVPQILKRFYLFWMTIAFVLGFFMTKVVLSLLFFTAFTVIGFFVRLSGKDSLDRTFGDETESYWIPYEQPKDVKRHLERQF
jgi:hypothetical protein